MFSSSHLYLVDPSLSSSSHPCLEKVASTRRGRALGLLTREDLADLGIKSVGHRLAILRARAHLRPQ